MQTNHYFAQVLKNHLLFPTTKEDHYRACSLEPNIKGQHTVSHRYRCAACHLLQFFTKNNLRIQKARVGVLLWVQLASLGYFLLCGCNQQGNQVRIYNKSFGDFIGTILAMANKGKINDHVA